MQCDIEWHLQNQRNLIQTIDRFFAKLIDLKEKGIEVYVFTGNHDLWLNDYLQKEIGATIYHQKVELQLVSTNCTKNVSKSN